MQSYRHPTKLHRLARLDLEAVSIGSAMIASVPALSPFDLETSTMLAVTLAVFAAPIAAVLGARKVLRRGLSLR